MAETCEHAAKSKTHINRSNCRFGYGCNSKGECETLSSYFGAAYHGFLAIELTFTLLLCLLAIVWVFLMAKVLAMHLRKKKGHSVVGEDGWETVKASINAIGGYYALQNLFYVVIICCILLALARDPEAYGGFYSFCETRVMANVVSFFFVSFMLNIVHSIFQAVVGNSKLDVSLKHTIAMTILKYNYYIKGFAYLYIFVITVIATTVTCKKETYWKTTTLYWFSNVFLGTIYFVFVGILLYFLRKHLLEVENFEVAAMGKRSIATEKIRTLYHTFLILLICVFICIIFSANDLYSALKRKYVKYPQAKDKTELIGSTFYHVFEVVLLSALLIRFIFALISKNFSSQTTTTSTTTGQGNVNNELEIEGGMDAASNSSAVSFHQNQITGNPPAPSQSVRLQEITTGSDSKKEKDSDSSF